MLYRKSPLRPPRLLLRIAATAGTGALVGAVACRSQEQCMGLCGPFDDGGPSGGGSGSSSGNGNVNQDCPILSPLRYDQSCTLASDCIAVGLGDSCLTCDIDCPNWAINQSAMAQYRSDVAASPANGTNCSCPASPAGPCCVRGTCQLGSQCADTVQEADTATDTGVGSDASLDARDASADLVADVANDDAGE
jgi:hypothetical protein